MLQGLHSLNLWARVSQFTLAFVATKSLPKHFKYFEVLSASILVCKVIFLFFFFLQELCGFGLVLCFILLNVCGLCWIDTQYWTFFFLGPGLGLNPLALWSH